MKNMKTLYYEVAYSLKCDTEFHFIHADDGEVSNVGKCDCKSEALKPEAGAVV